MRIPLVLIVAAAALAGCVREGADPLAGFKGEVLCQRPRIALKYVETRGKDSLLVAGLEDFRRRRPTLLDSLAADCPSGADQRGGSWDLMGAFETGDGEIQIAYFKRYPHDRMMAGCRVHLCFNRERSLEKVYVYEVPLE